MPKTSSYRVRTVGPDAGQTHEALNDLATYLPGRSFATSDGHAVTVEFDVSAADLAEAAAEALRAVAAAATVARCPVEPDHVSATRYA